MSMIGRTLAHYEITSQLGKGGMGEVYQAKDRKLGRDVAIKVLPEEFAKDTDGVARFQREAKLLASLNHPNIAGIHGLEEDKGTNFLVLELIEGDTLADRIKNSPIPVVEALKLALQIAEALEAAHEKGVIHRDLKPANIKVTPDGKVKVLDFGLAKAFAGEQAELNLSNSPTLSDAATQQGVILGTAAYMSPEQAKGKTVDKRADIWAFGVVLFEMLTGRQLFKGETVSETLAAVLMREPDFSTLPPNLHPRIRLLLERCLEKEPKNRYHDIADVRVDVQKALADPSGVLVLPTAGVESRTRLRTILPWVAVAGILMAVIAGVAVWKLKPPEPPRVSRFYYALPKDQRFSGLASQVLDVSPGGNQFVFSTSGGLYLQQIGELDARFIAGTDDKPIDPFFSPDGQWIGYWSQSDRKLKKISISGGAPVPLADVLYYMGAKWLGDNTIAYGTNFTGVQRISADGGNPERFLKAQTEVAGAPQPLPDGRSVVFVVQTGGGSQIAVQSMLESGKRKLLFAGTDVQYVPTGHLVYTWENRLYAVSFDIDRLETAGRPVSMVEDVREFAVSDSGTLVFIRASGGTVPRATMMGVGPRSLVWVDRAGKEEAINIPHGYYLQPAISPNGKYVASTFADPKKNNPNILSWDLIRETLTKLTNDEANNNSPLWTPDSRRILFSSSREGKQGVYWMAADGTGEIGKLGSAPDRTVTPICLSSDGKTLVTLEIYGRNRFGIGTLNMDGDHTLRSLLPIGVQPRISPDGRWMVYTSGESGQNEIYVRPFPEVKKNKWTISTKGGDSPLWSRDGHELFYRNGDAVIAVSVENEPTFNPGKPRILFTGAYVGTGLVEGTPWDISLDGKRFLMLKKVEVPTTAEEEPHRINVILNWFEELKQRVPVK
jgi:serine/threonine protein kinase